ncbi:hypothetical protein DVVG_00011 [Dunaliella viridis virus SI2]|uniref:hypothetical protein n=1 Tax=Dunaliella viridis virus SI2 TaxID=754069 RepID=UPI0002C1423E|nr:hypothetical protein DVVG_00011 [Dunaliella viridis virus SI2]AGH15997.1 hypothetical protein DVVG_00011 [Dunaliella viridis virus SI2]
MKFTDIRWRDYHLRQREQVFVNACRESGAELEQPPFAILWEDPQDPDAPARVTAPSPIWWAMALHGDILPPVEVYWALHHDERQPGFRRHHRGALLHDTPPMRAMSAEEAMAYLVMKDIPPAVWRDYTGNRTILRIVPRALVPTDRRFRNAWRIAQDTQMQVAA